jgi:hypothetical protein
VFLLTLVRKTLFSFVNVIVAESSATDVLNCKSFHLWIALQV